ncbi:MFS transporter [Shewanella intestini]|uniref:MFS transporter n=1 Tax=Shewanella intestini TaxID=2017544 RepID=A0ABS5HXB1_9GAMM|nr:MULTISPECIES: MFS transporter [Shewanella]MBR9726384.1 MFS transporter [Shewanella intestini]MRG35050.1 MFS transporter [Shewanella sp. XMDDZSB0408]
MKVNHLRWLVVSLVALATVINYIDRSALAIMWPSISQDLGLTKHDYANIISVFMIAYAVGQSLFGKVFDAIGTRFGFLLSILVWSISIALHAVASTAFSFALVRALLGIGEAGNWPGATKANAEWFPAKERALAQGIFNSGASLGSIIAPPLIAVLFAFIGWKATFIVIAILGFLWVIPWMIIYKSSPDTHPWITEQERQHILSGQIGGNQALTADNCANKAASKTDEYVPTLSQLLRHKQSWSVIAARFFIDPIWWLFVAWLPLYLNEKFGFNVKQIGAFAWVPYVGAAIGAIFGGWLSGKLIDKHGDISRARRSCITFGALIMLPSLLLTTQAATPIAAMGLIALILFGFQTAIGNIQTLPSDYFSGKSVGTLAGISGTSAVLSVIITIQLVPGLTQHGDYSALFILGAILVPMSLISIWLGGKITPVKKKAD